MYLYFKFIFQTLRSNFTAAITGKIFSNSQWAHQATSGVDPKLPGKLES